MKKLIALVCISALLAPAPWGIALNHQTHECAGFWAGDEYGYYALPEGWTAYYPDNHDMIQTEIGSCQWDRHNWEERAHKCCQQLGYTYVGDNIGRGGPTLFTIGIIACLACPGLALVAAVGLAVAAATGALAGGGYWLHKKSQQTSHHQGKA